MTALYKLLHYVPNPFSGARVPVAALLRDADGLVRVIAAPHLPDAACLGSKRSERAIRFRLADIKELTRFDTLPRGFGSQFVLGPEQPAPADGAEDWLRRVVFPAVPHGAVAHKSVQRRVLGRKYFQEQDVAHLVRDQFRNPRDQNIPAITHFVEGGGGVMLMEPLSSRLRPDPETDVTNVLTRLRAHHDVTPPAASFWVYVLPGSPGRDAALAAQAREKVPDWAAVIDLNHRDDARSFLDRVRQGVAPLLD
jgi:hypothetical protein